MSLKFETNSRPHRSVDESLKNEDTPINCIELPVINEEPYENYTEYIGSEGFKEIVENFKKYVNETFEFSTSSLSTLSTILAYDHNSITNIEYPHREELERLAIELVTKELCIPEGSFNFDVKINFQDEILNDDFSKESSEKLPKIDTPSLSIPSVDIPSDDIKIDILTLEKIKRRFCNYIIQGASRRGHYMFHLVEDRLKEITHNDDIVNFYGRMMSLNDTLYWLYSTEQIKSYGMPGGDGGSPMAGKEKIDRNSEIPTIFVRAINFPVLVHEIIKGIMDVFASHGLPESYDEFKDTEDTLDNETWELRLGPVIWKKFKGMIPIEFLIEEDKKEIQNYIFVEFFKLPADDFVYFIGEMFKDSEESKSLMKQIVDRACLNYYDSDEDEVDD